MLASALVALVVHTAIAPAPGARAQAAPDWPSLQGGPAHLGAVSAGAPAPPLDVAWRSSFGDGRVSGAVVTEGTAIVLGRTAVIAFDPATGSVRWRVRRSEGPLVPPAVLVDGDGGLLVFPEGTGPSDGALVALDLVTRRRAWTVPLGDQARGAPSISGGLAFVGTRDRSVHAVEVASGRVAWRTAVEGTVDAAPAVAEGTVYAVAEDSRTGAAEVVALDAPTGERRWTHSPATPAAGATGATVDRGAVYVGLGDGTVRALSAATGSVRWTARVRSAFSSLTTPASSGGDVYVADIQGGLYRFRGGTGARRWDFQFPAFVVTGAPLVASGTVLLGLQDGTVAAVATGSGRLVWQERLGPGPIGPLAPAGDLLLAPSAAVRGGISALRADPDGRLTSIPSPTTLDVGEALANFLLAALIVLAGALVLSRLALRGRPAPGLDGERGRAG